MKLRHRLLTLIAFAATSLASPRAEPCAGSYGPVFVTTEQPDWPVDHYVDGHLGLVSGDFPVTALIVAYRHLAGLGLDATERAAALEVFLRRSRYPEVVAPGASSSPSSPPPATVDPVDAWRNARAAVLGDRGPEIETTFRVDYAGVDNCLADAFRVAARTLEGRVAASGAHSPVVRAWIAGQDAVFRNCNRARFFEPPALAADASPSARRDRAYQLASANFYAGHFDEAERLFRAIATDAASSWAQTARYTLARVMVRRAVLAEHIDAPTLERAEQHLRAIVADVAMRPWHAAATSYLDYVRALRTPIERYHELVASLGHDHLGARFGDTFYDAAVLASHLPVSNALHAADDLETWIRIVRTRQSEDFESALRLFTSTRSAPWLVAALMCAPDSAARDARLAPLLRAAEQVRPDAPAFVTANYHRARLLLARSDTPRASVAAALNRALADLPANDGPSARNHLHILAARAAPDLNAFLSHASAVPAGYYGGDVEIFPVPATHAACRDGCIDVPVLHEFAGSTLSRVPVSVLVEAIANRTIASSVRGVLASRAYVRALLLNDRRATEIGRVLAREAPALEPYVSAIAQARNDAAQRLATAWFLVHVQSADWHFLADESAPASIAPPDHSSVYWCARSSSAPAAAEVAFLTAPQRRQRDAEQRTLDGLGGGATYVARLAVTAAQQSPDDPRVPELLHLAVTATRFGCRDANTLAASRAAFALLHRRFPHNHWTQETRYFYGAQ